MSVRVRLLKNCLFDFGSRTDDKRMLVKQHVKAVMEFLGRHSGKPPGAQLIQAVPPSWTWTDGNWEVGYTLEQTGGVTTVDVHAVRLRPGSVFP